MKNSGVKWIPPDLVALQMMIRKAKIDTPDAKYFCLYLVRKYRIATTIEHQMTPRLNKKLYYNEDFTQLTIAKFYFPLDSELITIKGRTRRQEGDINVVYDRLAVRVPNCCLLEIDLPKLWPADIQKQLRIHLQNSCHLLLEPSLHRKYESQDQKCVQIYHLLTDKNWKVISKEPTNAVQVDLTKLDTMRF